MLADEREIIDAVEASAASERERVMHKAAEKAAAKKLRRERERRAAAARVARRRRWQSRRPKSKLSAPRDAALVAEWRACFEAYVPRT